MSIVFIFKGVQDDHRIALSRVDHGRSGSMSASESHANYLYGGSNELSTDTVVCERLNLARDWGYTVQKVSPEGTKYPYAIAVYEICSP